MKLPASWNAVADADNYRAAYDRTTAMNRQHSNSYLVRSYRPVPVSHGAILERLTDPRNFRVQACKTVDGVEYCSPFSAEIDPS